MTTCRFKYRGFFPLPGAEDAVLQLSLCLYP